MTNEMCLLLELGCAQLGIDLTPQLRYGSALLADELRKWGKKINLTAIRDEKDVVIKHLLDSLTLCWVIGISGRLLDLGSGAGFPAIPLQLARPQLQVVSVDAVEKKIIFQRHIARLLGLHNFTPRHARGEDLPGLYAGHFDWIVSRAFADIPGFVRMSLPLLATKGYIIAMKGGGGEKEIRLAEAELKQMSVRVVEVVNLTLPVSGDARSIIVMAGDSISMH